jgi:hypothetical protein
MESSFSALLGSAVAVPFPKLEDQVVVCAYVGKRLNREVEPPTSRLTLDIKEIHDPLQMVVMPYDGMQPGDEVKIEISVLGLDLSREIMGKVLEEGQPVIITVARKELSAHVGYYVELSASVNDKATSKRQTIFIIDEGESAPLSKVPRFEDVTGHVIYADDFKEGAALIGEDLIDAEAGDAGVVFDEQGALVAWQFLGSVEAQRDAKHSFTIAYEWLLGNDLTDKKLFIQSAGANRAGRSLPLSFAVSQKRNLPKPVLVSGESFHDARAGVVVAVEITSALSGGQLTMYVVEVVTDTDGKRKRIVHVEASACYEERGKYVFVFPSESLGVVLGRENVYVDYSWSVGDQEEQFSEVVSLGLASPGDGDIKHFPKIQCEEYSGTVGLSVSRLKGAPVHVRVGKWLFMGLGQRIEIYAEGKPILVDKTVDQDDMEKGYVRGVVDNKVIVGLGAGNKLELTCEIVFNNGLGEPVWLQPVVLSIVA